MTINDFGYIDPTTLSQIVLILALLVGSLAVIFMAGVCVCLLLLLKADPAARSDILGSTPRATTASSTRCVEQTTAPTHHPQPEQTRPNQNAPGYAA